MRLEKAQPDDAGDIYAVHQLTPGSGAGRSVRPCLDDRAGSVETVRRDLVEKVCLKAVLEGRIVGSVCAWLADETCHIAGLAVDPAFSGRGVEIALLYRVEGVFRGTRRYELAFHETSESIRRICERAGYAVLSGAGGGRGEDAVVWMEKRPFESPEE